MKNITISDWAIVWATLTGPLIAILISLWMEQRRQKKATRLSLLHTLLNTMSVPHDPAYQVAMKGIAIEYRSDKDIMEAHREVRNAARAGPDGKVTRQKLVRLIALLFQKSGTKLSDDDVEGLDYVTDGFVVSQTRAFNAMESMVKVAEALESIAESLKPEETSSEDRP